MNKGTNQVIGSRGGVLALGVGLMGLALSAAGWFFHPKDFFRAYLLAFLFWISFPLGALAFLMLYRLTGGWWGRALRRPLAACVSTLPLMALLFLPLLAGLTHLYPWMGEHGRELGHKLAYLNAPAFLTRTAIYFLFWIATGLALVRLGQREDRASEPWRAGRLAALSAGGLVLHVLAVTFAGFDWIMSLEPEWFSTIYGLYILAGMGLTAMAFVTAVIGASSAEDRRPPPVVLQDVGNLLFMMIFFYAYVAFSQWLIIWSGNLPEEVRWYVERSRGGWGWIPPVLAAFHFALPFGVLLSRPVKRDRRALLTVALLVLSMRLVDWAWLVLPAFEGLNAWTWLLSGAALIGVGGLWLAAFGWLSGKIVEEAWPTTGESRVAGEAQP